MSASICGAFRLLCKFADVKCNVKCISRDKRASRWPKSTKHSRQEWNDLIQRVTWEAFFTLAIGVDLNKLFVVGRVEWGRANYETEKIKKQKDYFRHLDRWTWTWCWDLRDIYVTRVLRILNMLHIRGWKKSYDQLDSRGLPVDRLPKQQVGTAYIWRGHSCTLLASAADSHTAGDMNLLVVILLIACIFM